eukprot:m.180040 g.180040  ORF g.180040 m.180040 type:complete len:537 (-) comp17421_c0_seq1:262-1872(-)
MEGGDGHADGHDSLGLSDTDMLAEHASDVFMSLGDQSHMNGIANGQLMQGQFNSEEAGENGEEQDKDGEQTKLPPCNDPTKYCGFCCKMEARGVLITCFKCGNSGHASCLQLSPALEARIRANPNWVCIECKDCAICETAGNDDKLLFCDTCDEGVHTFCLIPPLTEPPEGAFECPKCLTGVMPKRPAPPEYRPKQTATGSTRGRKKKPPTERKLRRSPSPENEESIKVKQEIADETTSADRALFRKIQEDVQMNAPMVNTRTKKRIVFGGYEVEAWYSSPYPEEYMRQIKIFFCEYCLQYMTSAATVSRHRMKCDARGHPPGTEIYRDMPLQIWEVDGKDERIYCQNLCLLAKLFLDHKTLYFDVEPFLFYVLTERDEYGAQFIGYFSKEKSSYLQNNVSCILTMPFLQRKGYGKTLIDFSYLLSRVEKRPGTPEKPLSDLGRLTYESYWRRIVLSYLVAQNRPGISVYEISVATGMHPTDVVSTLQRERILQYVNGEFVLAYDLSALEAILAQSKPFPRVDASKLKWTPHVYAV